MDMIRCKLHSIVETIDQLQLSEEHAQCINRRVTSIQEQLSEIPNKETNEKPSCDTILRSINEIESLLFLPAINHLLLSSTRDERNSLKKGKSEDAHKNSLELQQTETNEELKGTHIAFIAQDECANLDSYWQRRTERVHALLDDTSLHFNKNVMKKTKLQPSLNSSTEVREKGKGLAKDRTRKMSCRSSEGQSVDKYSQQCSDTFWEINEEFSEDGETIRKFGDTICVLNCKSELKKLTAFLKSKGVRSFYIKRKPNGLAGKKGTWITPPYLPPFEVKYGWPAGNCHVVKI